MNTTKQTKLMLGFWLLVTAAVLTVGTSCEHEPYTTDYSENELASVSGKRLCFLSLTADPTLDLAPMIAATHVDAIRKVFGAASALDSGIVLFSLDSCGEPLRLGAIEQYPSAAEVSQSLASFDADVGLVVTDKFTAKPAPFFVGYLSLRVENRIALYGSNGNLIWDMETVSVATLAGLNPLTWLRIFTDEEELRSLWGKFMDAHARFIAAVLAEDILGQPHSSSFEDYVDPPDGIAYINAVDLTQ